MGSGFREARTVIMIVSIDCGAPMPCGAGSSNMGMCMSKRYAEYSKWSILVPLDLDTNGKTELLSLNWTLV